VSAPLALQRIIRQTESLHGTPARDLTTGKKMKENFRLTFSQINCEHREDCGCLVKLEGISDQTAGFLWEGKDGRLSDQYREASASINAFSYNGKNMLNIPDLLSEEWFFKANVPTDSTMKLVTCPEGEQPVWPQEVRLYDLDIRVRHSLKRADFRFLKHKFPQYHLSWSDMKEIWGESGLASLKNLCMRRESMYHWVCGLTNGRPHVLAAMANLYPRKLAKAILTMSRKPLGDKPIPALEHLGEAMDHMYRKMKIDLSATSDVKFSFSSLAGMYLGASNGCNQGKKFSIPPTPNVPYEVKVSPKGKKIDTFEQDLAAILHFIATGEEPGIAWTLPPKTENFYDFLKQNMSPADWAKFENKLRVFNIPNSIYILLERMVSRLRHLRERGWVIRIGHPWSYGGADTIAQCLGIDETSCDDPIVVEADTGKFDQSVFEFFVNLYWSSMCMYYDESMGDFQIFELICKFLCRNMIIRLTRLFGKIWALVKGGVPSGAYNTSHMDSWIMALYFFLFAVFQIHNAPVEHKEELEMDLLLKVFFADYGDDLLYNKGKGLGAHYFSGVAFADFLKKHFDVELRDMKDGLPFCTVVMDGWIIKLGASFLKYQFVRNPCKDLGQSKFIPFRESRDFLIRAVYGRVTKSRDVVDTLVSIIGHAYGTYASNRDAYDRLFLFYAELLAGSPELITNLPQEMEKRLGVDDLKKMRQMGMTVEELVSGFPKWETIVEKNRRDEIYQDTTAMPMDLDDFEVDADAFGW